MSPGRALRIRDFVVIYEWWAATINLLLVILLGLSARWWLRPARLPSVAWLAERTTPRWFWPLVIGAMALTLSWGVQRIPQSLWDDKIPVCTVRFLVNIGTTNGKLKLKEATWEIALWNYWKPANHQLQTILSKACLETWRALTRPVGLQFSEPTVRFPCLVAGISRLAPSLFLLKRLDFRASGCHRRFCALGASVARALRTIELRGYIFTLLFDR